MKIHTLHSWDLTPKVAVQLQRELAGRVDDCTPLPSWDLVAGADISYSKFNPKLWASVVLYRVSDGRVVETVDVTSPAAFPYIPGLLSFREAPPLLEAFARLKKRPDAVMIDGHGIAHPRRIGIASHLGLWLGIPTIGCAKSLLCGTHDDLAETAGSLAPLVHRDELVGFAVRTKNRIKPMFVSVGHKIDLASAVRVAMSCACGYRIPEPTRLAHLRVNELRRGGT